MGWPGRFSITNKMVGHGPCARRVLQTGIALIITLSIGAEFPPGVGERDDMHRGVTYADVLIDHESISSRRGARRAVRRTRIRAGWQGDDEAERGAVAGSPRGGRGHLGGLRDRDRDPQG